MLCDISKLSKDESFTFGAPGGAAVFHICTAATGSSVKHML